VALGREHAPCDSSQRFTDARMEGAEVEEAFMGGVLVAGLSAWLMLASQERAPANESLAMMAHWRCQVWAGMAGDEGAAKAHYDRGYASGSRFVAAARAGQIEPADFDAIVPIYISLSMAGPSDDFVLGRLYEITTEDAFDRVVKRDSNNGLRAPSDYLMDREVRAIVAGELFRSSNCAAL